MIRYSIVVPVYNRPDEIKELLDSLSIQTLKSFEVIIVEDGSQLKSDHIVNQFSGQLDIHYFFKENSGPGDSRNFGMKHANGQYFIILDSDCILPPEYMDEVDRALSENYADCFGGVDAALDSFSEVQKAINFAMTSVLTTGGVRGGSEKLGKFQPRSFNMGISRKAFDASGGFGKIHPGEDPDLSIRLWKMGFETRLYPSVYVFHKRRIDWGKFKLQVKKFGMVRPILDSWHPEYAKLTFFFPSVFLLGLLFSVVMGVLGWPYFLLCYLFYFILCFILSSVRSKSIFIGLLSVWAVFVQFYGYGTGFIRSFIQIRILGRNPEQTYPGLFFKSKG